MRTKRPVAFKISDMDGLGQGVSKVTDKITFIPKTLPGEEGEAEIISEKKGVAFASVTKITSTSPARQAPVCPHFTNCPSCHYLHTDYQSELKFKGNSLERIFRNIPHPPIEVVGAPRRLEYRNRVQLHYDVRQKKLGMFDGRTETIQDVPLCTVGNSAVTKALQELYFDRAWEKIAAREKPSGHVEIYDSPQGLKISWNRPYAEGGFTQVFSEMNQKLKSQLETVLAGDAFSLLDLFAGNGNLSEKLNYSHRLCVDVYNEPKKSPFLSQDLYSNQALTRVKAELTKQKIKTEVLLLDPPRSGMKDLNLWLEEFTPKKVIYVSCDPNTLGRDLLAVKGYTLVKLFLYDFFPSTHHYESMVFLERN